MELIKQDNIFILKGTTYQDRMIPKQAGFRWKPEKKYWWTKFEDSAVKLIEYASDDLKKEFAGLAKEREENFELSKALDSDLNIPVPDGLEYYGYQKGGIAFALNRLDTSGVLLADEMGLGKTPMSIGVMNAKEDIRKVLVICPASLKVNWKREVDKWNTRGFTSAIVMPKHFPTNANVIIINYDIVRKYKDILMRVDWDLLVADECHFLKNSAALRTLAIYGGTQKKKCPQCKNKSDKRWSCVHCDKKGSIKVKHEPIKARYRICITGTPILNRPVEIFTTINYLDPKSWPSWWGFTGRYCNRHNNGWGLSVDGASNLSELQEKLRSSIMVRRLKKDVLKDLPDKVRQVIELPANGSTGIVNAERSAYEQHEDRIEELKAQVELAKASDNPEDYEKAVEDLKDGQRVAFEEIAEMRKQVALAKIPYVVDHVANTLESEEKVLIFAHHHEVIDKLMQELAKFNPVKLTGRESQNQKQHAVDSFQSNESVRVFIGSIRAAGVGLTLTASNHVIFAELDFVPGVMSQCEDRTHRIGQQNNVLVQHLVLEESLDANIARTLVKKQNIIDKALDKEIDKAELTAIATSSGNGAATTKVKRSKFDSIADKIAESDVPVIHSALQLLAARCDGARSEDGAGFNKLDSRIGKELAANMTLTKRQAALGLKICQRYNKTQLDGILNEVIERIRS